MALDSIKWQWSYHILFFFSAQSVLHSLTNLPKPVICVNYKYYSRDNNSYYVTFQS